MATNCSLTMIESCRVSPFTNSRTTLVAFSLPLTYFDIKWLKFFPAKQIFFYQLAQHESTHTFFNSVILPKVKHFLSLTLTHFLPLVGNVLWPVDSVKPFILYSPNDNVSLKVAEANSNINHLVKEATDLHPYIPELRVSDSKASIVAFQITFFPGQGFYIGTCLHHGILDGKSTAVFMKAWAYISKQNSEMNALPLDLTPVFNRTVVHYYPEEVDIICLNNLLQSSSDPNLKSLKLLGARTNFGNLVRATFEFSREDINRLRQIVVSLLNLGEKEDAKHMRFSTFVLSLAYTLVCITKAKMVDKKGKIGLLFSAESRSRLVPPLPTNYFANFYPCRH